MWRLSMLCKCVKLGTHLGRLLSLVFPSLDILKASGWSCSATTLPHLGYQLVVVPLHHRHWQYARFLFYSSTLTVLEYIPSKFLFEVISCWLDFVALSLQNWDLCDHYKVKELRWQVEACSVAERAGTVINNIFKIKPDMKSFPHLCYRYVVYIRLTFLEKFCLWADRIEHQIKGKLMQRITQIKLLTKEQ
jgi:hypothetical protein